MVQAHACGADAFLPRAGEEQRAREVSRPGSGGGQVHRLAEMSAPRPIRDRSSFTASGPSPVRGRRTAVRVAAFFREVT